MEDLYVKIEEYLSKKSILRLRGVDKIEASSVKELVEKILLHNRTCTTVYLGNSYQIQTSSGRRRSIGDIYLIAKFYNPEVSIKEIQSSLLDLCFEGKLQSIICCDIHRRVWRHSSGDSLFSCFPKDEFGLSYDVEKIKGQNKAHYLTEYEKYLEKLL